MSKKHLTLSERIELEKLLNEGLSFRQIAINLGKSHTTISREVNSKRTFSKIGGYNIVFNDCINAIDCPKKELCNFDKCTYKKCHSCKFCYRLCKKYEKQKCEKISKAPFVCNGCENRKKCRLEKCFYKAKSAQTEYDFLISDARYGINISEEQLAYIDGIVSPLIIKGQSIHAIYANNKDELMIDERTLYNYINAGFLSCKRIDQPRAVKYKTRKTPKRYKVDKKCRKLRTYKDFEKYIKRYPDTLVVQMDTVIGRRGGKSLLTLHFPIPKLMLAILLNKNNSKSVIEAIDNIYGKVGKTSFKKLFKVILTDNGSEFSNPLKLELDKDDKKRTRIFYCNPYASYQKPAVENNHALVRRILPKGISFDDLSQSDIDLALSHINSYIRRDLGDKTPYDVFVELYGDKLLKEMNISCIKSNDIVLKPSLLKQKY